MKYFLLSCVLLLCNGLYAQKTYSIRGLVKDATNGETLLGATVALQNTNYGSITNEYGFYSVSANEGSYTVSVSYLGYNTLTQIIKLDTDYVLNFELEAATTTLNEIVIMADDIEALSIKNPQMSVSKLSSATIKKIPVVLGEVDVLKSIQLLPGVTNNGEGSSGFNVRGGAVDQNLVLLDEAIIYNTSHFFGFFSIFNADAIKDINLYKGDIPAKYGGRVASVLDVRQKDGNSKNFSLTGGVGLIASRLAAEGPLLKNKGSFLVAGRSSYAHLFLKASEDFKDDKISFYDLNLKANYELNKNNKIYISGYFGRDIFNLSNLIENNYGNVSANLRWNHIYNDKLFSNISLIYSKYDYQIILDFIELNWISNIKNLNLKYDFKYYVNNKLKFDFGVSAITYKLNPGEINPSSETSPINYRKLDTKRALETGIYINTEHEITTKLTAQYGLRLSGFSRLGGQNLSSYQNNQPVIFNRDLEIYENGILLQETYITKNERIKNFANLEPRLGLSYQLNEETAVKASYTKTTQYLHLLSNTASVTPLDVWTPSGTFIKPQIGNQVALGYFKNFNNKNYSLEIESYYKAIKNRIDYIDGSNLIGNNNIETEILNGDARAYGLEILIKKNVGKLSGWLAYTLSKSEQRTLGGQAGGPGINNGNWYHTPFDRTHDISVTGSYELNQKWQLSANVVFQTGRPITYPNGQYTYEGLSVATYSNRNENRLPAYHRLDVSATYTPNNLANRRWKGEWVFGVYNLYNRRNAASISFNQNSETGLNEATRISIFGIIPSVTYNFKF